ncbi:unnamed protein product [Orchesella dallaii]|uniref:Uncharacterized protein n=1 Tax=Orchesella dallaii TaxID=48710 RepID=A0ABP1QPC7_9HEXA
MADEQPPETPVPTEEAPPPPPPQEEGGKKLSTNSAASKKQSEDKGKGAVATKTKEQSKKKDPKGKKPERKYLGWLDANNIEWKTYMEYMGYKNWLMKYGPSSEWGQRYKEWICSGMTRGAMRKPSYRAVEWLKYQRGIEVAPVGECCTRKRCSIRDYFIEPVDNYCCRPCPWPKTTSGEYGWLAQHQSCQLEIYPNDFMKKPPLPWHHKKISSFLPGTM